jgi:hypothetical protein
MERHLIDKLEGINRNAVEAVSGAPQGIKNFAFSRSGGLIARGGRTRHGLANAIYSLLGEDGSSLLDEDGSEILDEWSTITDFGADQLLAYDEVGVALLSGPRLWANGELVPLAGDPFMAENDLALAPRVGVISPWSTDNVLVYGGAYYRDAISGGFSYGPGAGTVTFGTTGGGPGIPAGTYQFAWTVEAPTDGGLVTHAAARAQHIIAGPATSIDLTLSLVYPSGTLVRFYYRSLAEEDFEQFAAFVSDGVNAPTASLVEYDSTTFVPSLDALVSFGGGRVEAHNGRMWGRAANPAFMQFRPDTVLVRSDGYMLRAGEGTDTERHRAAVALGDMPMSVAGDYIELVARRVYVRRPSGSSDVIVELFDVRKSTSTTHRYFGFLRYRPGVTQPTLEVKYSTNAARAHPVMAQAVVLAQLALGTTAGAELDVANVTLRMTVSSVTQDGGTGRIIATGNYTLTAGAPPASQSVSTLAGAFTPTLTSRSMTATGSGFFTSTGGEVPVTKWNAPVWTYSDLPSGATPEGTSTSGMGRLIDANNATGLRIVGAYMGQYTVMIGHTMTTARYVATATVYMAITDSAMTGPGDAPSVFLEALLNGIVVSSQPVAYTAWTGGVFIADIGTIIDGLRVRIVRTSGSSDTGGFTVYELYPNGSLTTAWADWGSWIAQEASSFALGRIPSATNPGVGAHVTGSRQLWVDRISAHRTGGAIVARGDITDYVSGTSWANSVAPNETWTVNSDANMVLLYAQQAFVGGDADPITQPDLTLVYSTTGSVNRGTIENFVRLSPLSSRRITALSSTPAGLLVFMENETFLVRGDPAIQGSFGVQRLSGVLGCDPNTIPARLGASVAVVYKGEIYGINLGGGDVDFGGSIANLSQPVWLPDDPFVQVIGDPERSEFVAVTNGGRVFVFDAAGQKWRNDTFDEVADLRYLLPPDAAWGVGYNVGGFIEVVDPALNDTPLVRWEALDLGDKNLTKLWRRIELFTELTGNGAPTLTYTVRSETRQVVGLDMGRGRWVFNLHRGMVGSTIDLHFEFLGATSALVLEPPVVVEFVPRYRQR